MSSDKVSETKDSVMDTAEKTKHMGGEKAEGVKTQVESAGKSEDPSFTDQAKEKAADAQSAATTVQEQVTGAVAEGWSKTKETFSNLNQYPDKK